MANRDIDYEQLILNVKEMINLLEYDSMRSAGKVKLNSNNLHSLYYLLDVYRGKLKPEKNVASKAAVQKAKAA